METRRRRHPSGVGHVTIATPRPLVLTDRATHATLERTGLGILVFCLLVLALLKKLTDQDIWGDLCDRPAPAG